MTSPPRHLPPSCRPPPVLRQVPILIDGDTKLVESMVIVNYLEQKVGWAGTGAAGQCGTLPSRARRGGNRRRGQVEAPHLFIVKNLHTRPQACPGVHPSCALPSPSPAPDSTRSLRCCRQMPRRRHACACSLRPWAHS